MGRAEKALLVQPSFVTPSQLHSWGFWESVGLFSDDLELVLLEGSCGGKGGEFGLDFLHLCCVGLSLF